MPIKDAVGKKYGKLKVLSFVAMRNRNAHWLCVCDCGRSKIANGSTLRSGSTSSCGCAVGVGNRKAQGVSGFNSLYVQYLIAAKARGHDFQLSKGEFRSLVKSDCTYCGSAPAGRVGSTKHARFEFNGIDRIDNSKGYYSDNCTSCCKICNYMKRKMTLEEFMTHIRKIAGR